MSDAVCAARYRPKHRWPLECRSVCANCRARDTAFYVGLAALIITGCAWLGVAQHPIAFPLDDAYITLHNAQVLWSGSDRNYPGVPALMGATSPVHLALVAGLMLVFDPLVASFVA